MSYDSTADTNAHIATVRALLHDIVYELQQRARDHDASKLIEPEKSMFDEFSPKLKQLGYGSEEYKQVLTQMGEALKHHYAANRHHPEHFQRGVGDMNLLDVLEMIADWKAAALRVKDGDLNHSLKINRGRFQISPEVYRLIHNTARDLGWLR